MICLFYPTRAHPRSRVGPVVHRLVLTRRNTVLRRLTKNIRPGRMVQIAHGIWISGIRGIRHDMRAQDRHRVSRSAETTVFPRRHEDMDLPAPHLHIFRRPQGGLRAICLQDPETDGTAGGNPRADLAQLPQEFRPAARGSGAPSQSIKSFMFWSMAVMPNACCRIRTSIFCTASAKVDTDVSWSSI